MQNFSSICSFTINIIFIFRFAKFIEGESHLNDDEVLSFETESRKNMDDMLTDDDSDED